MCERDSPRAFLIFCSLFITVEYQGVFVVYLPRSLMMSKKKSATVCYIEITSGLFVHTVL